MTTTRIHIIARPNITGTLTGYYAPLHNGTRNAKVTWDDASIVMTINEIQIEAI